MVGVWGASCLASQKQRVNGFNAKSALQSGQGIATCQRLDVEIIFQLPCDWQFGLAWWTLCKSQGFKSKPPESEPPTRRFEQQPSSRGADVYRPGRQRRVHRDEAAVTAHELHQADAVGLRNYPASSFFRRVPIQPPGTTEKDEKTLLC